MQVEGVPPFSVVCVFGAIYTHQQPQTWVWRQWGMYQHPLKGKHPSQTRGPFE